MEDTVSIEQLEQVGHSFINYMRQEYPNLKKAYHEDKNVKDMMDLPSYCFTMFVIAIKSYDAEIKNSF